MASAVALVERYTVSEGDVRRRTIRFSGVLDVGEKISGAPQVIYSGTDLVFSGQQVNGVLPNVAGRPTPAGQSVSFTEQGQVAANGPYRYTVKVATTQGQTLNCDVIVDVAGQPGG